jgi:hypothetical protein
LNLPKCGEGDKVINADIADSNLDISEEYDIVFSHEVFEHLAKPWIAAENCLKLTKVNGLNIHIAPFAWRYHPFPIDCFRYTHAGFKALFDVDNYPVEIVASGYDIGKRRGNVNTQYGFWKSARDMPPRDKLGGFMENWETLFACRRISFRYD